MGPKVGQVFMSYKEKQQESFFEVTATERDNSGLTWILLKGLRRSEVRLSVPLIFFEKDFLKISDKSSTVLFGGYDEKG